MNNSNVAHLWAAQGKPSAKGSNMFFDGPVIYSYGRHFPIANIIPANGKRPRVILFTSRDYSVTTAKHKGQVRRAIPDSDIVFTVPNVRGAITNIGVDHNANVEYLIAEARRYAAKALRAVKYVDNLAGSARARAKEAAEYAAVFGKDIKAKTRREARAIHSGAPWTKREAVKIAAKTERAKALVDIAEAREAARRRAKLAEALPYLERWAAGETVTAHYSAFYHFPCRLRVLTTEKTEVGGVLNRRRVVQTSHGAEVNFTDAVRLLGAWQAGTVEIGAKIGPYTVEAVTPELITIGCHKIERAEAERVIVPAAGIR